MANPQNGIQIGINTSGEGVLLPPFAGAVLVGGLPGSGKSNLVQLLVAQFIRLDSAKTYLIDPKLVELSGWRYRVTRFGVSGQEAVGLLDEVIQEMDQRFSELKTRGLRKISPSRSPMLVVIEEITSLLGTPEAKQIEQRLRHVMTMGRAAGILVVLVAQRPGVDTLPGSIRDLAEVRIAFRTATPDTSDTILGRGWASMGADASKIPSTQRGVAYLNVGGEMPHLIRCYYLSDARLAQLQGEPPRPLGEGEGDERVW